MVFCYGSLRELIGRVLPYCVGDTSLAQKTKFKRGLQASLYSRSI